MAYVALGANLDDPLTQVQHAIEALWALPHSRLLAVSSLYRTAPVGIHGQPDFINAVASLETTLEPLALLDKALGVESAFGRRRDYPLAPRTLDLDLLLYDDQRIDTAKLALPHPRMHLRAFVLAPPGRNCARPRTSLAAAPLRPGCQPCARKRSRALMHRSTIDVRPATLYTLAPIRHSNFDDPYARSNHHVTA